MAPCPFAVEATLVINGYRRCAVACSFFFPGSSPSSSPTLCPARPLEPGLLISVLPFFVGQHGVSSGRFPRLCAWCEQAATDGQDRSHWLRQRYVAGLVCARVSHVSASHFQNQKKQNKTGHGAKATGKHTSKGGYEVDPNKVIDMVVPNLDGFMVAKDETKARKRLIPRVLSSSRTCQGRPGQGV